MAFGGKITVSDDRIANFVELLNDQAAPTIVLDIVTAFYSNGLNEHNIAKQIPFA